MNSKSNKLTEASSFIKALADENRLKIMCFLEAKEKCVCEIWQFLALPQNLVSHHLKVLKDVGLVDYEKRGLKVIYSVNRKNVSKYKSLLNKLIK